MYAAYLAREWKRAGHDVHAFAERPIRPRRASRSDEDPELTPPADDGRCLRSEGALLAACRSRSGSWACSRFGVFPEMQTFGIRLMRRWPVLLQVHGFDVVFANQCRPGLLGIQQVMGVPVVSVIHHLSQRSPAGGLHDRLRLSASGGAGTLYFPP
ncbi:MAG: glycosyltransferase [Myxococcota bacterium]